jgi:steroid delta-isomerase-like uncharacterized protein
MNPRSTQIRASLLIQAACSILLWCGCAVDRPHPLQRNKELVRRYFEGWANRGDPAVADALIATNVVLRNPPHVVHGLADYKRGMAAFHAAFPDLHFTIEEDIAEGNTVVTRWTLRATHQGEYQGRAPTGRKVTVTGISIFQIAGGRIQDITVNMDRFGQFEQLGWLPAPAPPPK